MDKINKNFNNNINQLSFKGDTNNMSKDEQIIDYTHKCVNFLYDIAQREVPENGIFSKVYAGYNVPESNNQVIFYIEYNENNPKDLRRLVASCHHKNSDRLFYQNMFEGTKSQILDFIDEPDNFKYFLDSAKHVSNTVDEYYSSR